MKILDALSMAKPLVSTSVGCEGLGLDSGSHLLIADGASALSDAIVRVLRDPALADKLGSAGREVVEQRFEWNVIGEQLNRVYQLCGRLRKANTSQSSR